MGKNNEIIQQKEDEITKRLDTIISIMLIQNDIQKYTLTQKIHLLTKLGFSNPEIASLLNTTLKSIEATKYKKPKEKK